MRKEKEIYGNRFFSEKRRPRSNRDAKKRSYLHWGETASFYMTNDDDCVHVAFHGARRAAATPGHLARSPAVAPACALASRCGRQPPQEDVHECRRRLFMSAAEGALAPPSRAAAGASVVPAEGAPVPWELGHTLS
jgi:hypothetical protein